MRILTVSDEVVPTIYSLSLAERFSAVECVLACGDLPYYYLEYVITHLPAPCFYVFGNHDSVEYRGTGEPVYEPQGCISLEGRSLCYKGLLLAGLGGSIRYNTSAGHQYEEWEMTLRFWRLAPRLFFNHLRYGRAVDVFVCHAPPAGIHDGPDRPHLGFQTFRTLMQVFQPRYLIHGHVHRSYDHRRCTETRHGQTQVINTAGYRLLDIDLSARSLSS